MTSSLWAHVVARILHRTGANGSGDEGRARAFVAGCRAGCAALLLLPAAPASAQAPAPPGIDELRRELAQSAPPIWDLADLRIEAQVDLRNAEPPMLRRRYLATWRLGEDTVRVIASDAAAVVVEPMALAGAVRSVGGLASSTLIDSVWTTDFPSPADRLLGVGLAAGELPAPAARRGSEAAAAFWRRQAERLLGRPAAAAREAVIAEAIRRRLDALLPDFVAVRALETVEASAAARGLRADLLTLLPTFALDRREGADVFLRPVAPAGEALTLRLRATVPDDNIAAVAVAIEAPSPLAGLGRPRAAFPGRAIVTGSPEEQAFLAQRAAARARALEGEVADLKREVEALRRRQDQLEQAPPVVIEDDDDWGFFVLPSKRRHRPPAPPPARRPVPSQGPVPPMGSPVPPMGLPVPPLMPAPAFGR
jgi:hypothetical protein